ncbi:MAG: type II toxin-antitoxin system VapC family toxin [Nanoarchaeota archaeon]|nr:type II toxin-antitoxin system VapC family toxin [Nanoarchaeota archaeon]
MEELDNKGFYVDSCIYINLWRKEEGKDKKRLWEIAEQFFSRHEQDRIYYSGFILKELQFVLKADEFKKCRLAIIARLNFRRLFLSNSEMANARKIESEINYEISFYDIIHMLLAKQANAILITRDRKLIKIAARYFVNAKLPEEAL